MNKIQDLITDNLINYYYSEDDLGDKKAKEAAKNIGHLIGIRFSKEITALRDFNNAFTGNRDELENYVHDLVLIWNKEVIYNDT